MEIKKSKEEIFEQSPAFESTFNTIVRLISPDSCKSFQIGKTGENVQNLFDNEYRGKYTNFEVIWPSENKSEIELLEDTLINHFTKSPGYKHKCENKGKNVSGMRKSNKYVIFVLLR